MIVSPAAAHARVTGPGGGSDTGSGTVTGGGTGTGSVLRRCLARRGMLHSECEAVDQLVLPPHVGVEHLGRAGVDEAWFVLSGTVTVDECDSPPWTLHAGQLMLSPAGTRPHIRAGAETATLLLVATLPDERAAQLPLVHRRSSMTSPAALAPAADDPVNGAWPQGSMRAVAVVAHRTVETVRVPIPGPLAGHALVRVAYAGLCGTDLELLHGTASYVLDGRATHPHVVGHEWSGTVVAAPPGSGVAPGQTVVGQTMVPCESCAHCRGGRRNLCPHMREVGLYGLQGAAAEYVRVPASSLVPVPAAVDARSAALVEPAVTVVEAFRRAGCRESDRVAVVGTGSIGLLAVQLGAHLASYVDAVGVDPAGVELATGLGARRGLLPDRAEPGAYSLVVEASGAPAGFTTALRLVEPGGRVAAIGVAHAPVPEMDAARITLDGISLLGIRHGLDHYDDTLGLFARGVLRADP